MAARAGTGRRLQNSYEQKRKAVILILHVLHNICLTGVQSLEFEPELWWKD